MTGLVFIDLYVLAYLCATKFIPVPFAVWCVIALSQYVLYMCVNVCIHYHQDNVKGALQQLCFLFFLLPSGLLGLQFPMASICNHLLQQNVFGILYAPLYGWFFFRGLASPKGSQNEL